MSLTLHLLNVPPSGLQIQHEVEPSLLSLSHDEGMVIGNLMCSGNLFLPDERSAYFQGLISGRVSRECVRCLTIYEDTLALSCEAKFQKPSAALLSKGLQGKFVKGYEESWEENKADEDIYPISGNDIDLLPAIREHVILATPLQCLCKEDCLGLCQVCGANLNEGMCECCTPVTASSPPVPFKQSSSGQNQPKRSSASVRKGS
jgi:uncharacterized protein